MSAANRYAELLETGISDQVCLTWCRIGDVEEVARRFGADPATGTWEDFLDVDFPEVGAAVQLVPLGGWTLAVEPYGLEGVRPEVAEELSRDEGRAFAVYWNVNLGSDVVYAENGRVLTTFDLMADIGERAGSDPAALDGMLARVGLHGGLPARARKERALALGEEISGQTLTVDLFRSPVRTFTITDPLPDAIIPPA
ncbi:DUF6461 domain-containing protein [Thermopolyspora flexuosa]|jgi:hypothetical protein|uniref:Uncharacterized protein n=1 Tax=Thermopolyspora flexuosa TaxID=103836 RepID=A0A543ITD6_9ACTN|nr:DUF6461 domain-containing protein [Thermopolyspora flexuosa]TQM73807.1 hypothetical protein FHX40_0461 [Thermopolyspora flexuosa]